MAEAGNDLNQPILNLSAEEKRAFSFLFNQADTDQLGVVTGERAVSFFERTHVNPSVLGEIWQIADTENRGLLTKPGFCMVLRLIGHYQAGRQPTAELAFKPGPMPKFDGLVIPGAGPAMTSPTSAQAPPNALQPQTSGTGPIRVPPLDPQKAAQYASLFEQSGAQNGLLDGVTAKSIFERAGLPNEVLGRIWGLSDREQRGALDQNEFIVAMHLLASMRSRTMSAVPNVLPPALYEAAARRGAPAQAAGRPSQTPVTRQFTGQARTQSPLATGGGFGSPPPSGPQWLITPAAKAKYDQFFATIDTQGRGLVTGDQAVRFFSDSRLPEDTLASIWDLADINSEGHLTKDEFAVAMYLIGQQRAPNAPPLPAFLPTALVPPSMRQQPQQQQSTAPAFDNANNTSNMPKSAAEDLFGLDASSPQTLQTATLQPQVTGTSASRDPFAGSQPGSPSSPQRFQPQPQHPGSMFKPFMPTSAFGASLAQQHTGGSTTSSQGQPRGAPGAPQPSALQQSSAADDLLGDSETQAAESGKLTNESTELANMSTQIGNLMTQTQQIQTKKAATQQDLSATNNQKRDLEQRLQQFRAQYEQEVRTVKELEQQLAASRDSTKKLGQDLAMLEGTQQDLQSQHNTVLQQLQADQQENASLKQKIAQINTEVARLKPEIEKMKLDARQQKGLVSINKKQLATNEAERDRLQSDKADLEREAAERSRAQSPEHHFGRDAAVAGGAAAVAAGGFAAYEATGDNVDGASRDVPAGGDVVSPAASTLSSTNPFFRKPSGEGQITSPAAPGPNPSAFDALFGPSSAFAPSGTASSRTGTPPATSFIGRSIPAPAGTNMTDSVSTAGEATPSVTPPPFEVTKESPVAVEPPPPKPDHRQFTPSQLPVGGLNAPRSEDGSSVNVIPPASRAGGVETPATLEGSRVASPAPQVETLPGAFPPDELLPSTSAKEIHESSTSTPTPAAKDDFDSAFASFGQSDKAKETAHEEGFPPAASTTQTMNGFSNEFPPIKNLEPEDDDDDSDEELERAFADDFTSSTGAKTEAPHAAVASVPTTSAAPPPLESQSSPPTYEQSKEPSHGGPGEKADTSQFPPQFGGLLPTREDPTSPDNHASGSTAPVAQPAQAPAKNVFDEFDDFNDLSEAKEADKTGDIDFGFGRQSTDEFNPAFDSPAASMTNTATSIHTPAASRNLPPSSSSNGFADFQPTVSTSSTFGSNNFSASSIQQTPASAQHDWDAIFSGLDSDKAVDTSLGKTNDPWGAAPVPAPMTTNGSTNTAPASSLAAATKPPLGRAITPGTDHDDPILKRLTNMGYPRASALNALEMYDYDINKAVDHLSGS